MGQGESGCLADQIPGEAKALPNFNKTLGARGTVDPNMLRIGAAITLGLLPPEHAVYIYRDFGLKGSECYKATYSKPGFKDKGFFSLTMYGSRQYLNTPGDNWYLGMRVYRPVDSIIEGTYDMPVPTLVSR